MAVRKVVPGSLTDAYKLREGDFAPNLVGNQFTSPNAFFTLGNFEITSNFSGRVSKDFTLGEWSEYYCLDNLNITEQELDNVNSNNIFVKLNFDTTKVSQYVYFGSFSKLLESELQDIIVKWPASLYISPIPTVPLPSLPSSVNTVLDFSYNNESKISYFKVPIVGINNPYGLNYNDTSFGDKSIISSISDYILSIEGNEFKIQNITGSTSNDNYIYLEIVGNPFPSLSGATFGQETFHIKPVKPIRDFFFNNLTDLQNMLLNRLTTPKYTYIIDVPVEYNDGAIGFTTKNFTWPTTDGYNLDINTPSYSDYVENLFNVSLLYDENQTNLMTRRLVSSSIIEYDTEGDGTDNTGRRVYKLLTIYGAEFDVVKKYIDGISFANVVTYNKKDNTADSLIKIMAKTLGFDVLLTINDGIDILTNNDEGDDPQFQGYSRELSPNQIDVELWRRLVINAWWLFRSKGTRKVLEFFMQLFGINSSLVSMDERVYLANNKLDLLEVRRQFNTLFGASYFDLNRNNFPFDDYGFPRVPTNTETFWFQNDGFWYNGGNEITTGNNPHYGPYDYGQRYWDKFRCFVDDFQPSVNVNTTEILTENYFTEYNDGTFTPDSNGIAFSYYDQGDVPDFFINPTDNINVISAGIVEFGTESGPTNVRDSGDTYSLRITFQAGESTLCDGCPPEALFGEDGVIYVNNPNDINGGLIPHNIEECCDYYWLPTLPIQNDNTDNTGDGCPEEYDVIPNDGYILVLAGSQDGTNTNNYLTQQCCYEYSLLGGFNQQNGVSWNSTIGCYLGSDEPVTPGGGVVGDGTGSNTGGDGTGGDGDGTIITLPGDTGSDTPQSCQLTTDGVINGVGGTFSTDTNGSCILIEDVPQTDWVAGDPVPATLEFQIDASNATTANPTVLDLTTKGPLGGIVGTVAAGTVLQDGINYTLQLISSTNPALPTPNTYYNSFLNPYQTDTFQIVITEAGVYTFQMKVYPYNSGDNYFQVCTNCNQEPPTTSSRGSESTPLGKEGEFELVPLFPNATDTGGQGREENDNAYYCWWCPPESSLIIVCDSQAYLNNLQLDNNGIINLATTYGYNGFDVDEAQQLLLNTFDTYFQQGKCVYMIGNQVLQNKDCCELRGGTWNNNLQLCELIVETDNCNRELVTNLYNTIVGTPLDETQKVDENNFEPLDQNCCESLGYYFGTISTQLFRLDGTVDIIPDSPLIQNYLINNNISRGACFDCPRVINETSGTTDNGTTIIYLTDSNGSYLSENCCQKYGTQVGFSSQEVLLQLESGDLLSINLCTRCNPNNLVVDVAANTVTTIDGQMVDQECCENGGYFYQTTNDPTNSLTIGCYQCPPFVDGNYVIQEIIFGGSPVLTYVDSNGNQLSEECCNFLATQNGNPKITWSNDDRGCYLQ